MQHLKTFSIFESTQGLTQEQKDFLDNSTGAWTQWSLNPEGLVDVQGDFDCSFEGIRDFKGIRFGRVEGDFKCSNNELESLKGAPREVSGKFSLSSNSLATLEGAPQKVGGSFFCPDNNLISLKGAPQEVGGGFYCNNNVLTTLEGSPQEIGGNFYCYSNNLTTLEGAPQKVGGDFLCYQNDLTTLEGAPQTIGGEFNSSFVDVPVGQWSLGTLIEMYKNSTDQERKLLGTLVSPEALQVRIDANPERAAVELKSIVNLPEFKGLRWPESLKPEIDLLSDLDGVGL